ncbi:phenylacetic acid degradation protein, partial [Streptomyces sp. SID11233]|nr:phenylacetic acid degradation protein [Streptomyces sp. SID11233]
MTATPVEGARPSARRRPSFHTLRVARVERLSEDAVAVGFDIPEELAEQYAHRPGQSLTLRRAVESGDERRSYSICSPAGT